MTTGRFETDQSYYNPIPLIQNIKRLLSFNFIF